MIDVVFSAFMVLVVIGGAVCTLLAVGAVGFVVYGACWLAVRAARQACVWWWQESASTRVDTPTDPEA